MKLSEVIKLIENKTGKKVLLESTSSRYFPIDEVLEKCNLKKWNTDAELLKIRNYFEKQIGKNEEIVKWSV